MLQTSKLFLLVNGGGLTLYEDDLKHLDLIMPHEVSA